MADFDLQSLKEVGGIFKFGSGVLGKSAIALGVLLVAVIVGAARLHSDEAIIVTILLGCVIFIAWFLYVLKFASDHPDIALLEGSEWSGYQRFHATAKGLDPGPSEQQSTLSPGLHDTLPTLVEPKRKEEESN